MLIIYLTLSLFELFLQEANAQKIELHPTIVDTLNEKIITVHKRYATLYFKQSDIHEYVESYNTLRLPGDQSFPVITSLLQSCKKRIDLNDWINEYSDEEKKLFPRFISGQGIDQIALPEMWYIGSDLIRESKFMIIDNNTKKIIYSGLTLTDQNNAKGTGILLFKLSSGFHFWQTIYMIGN